MSTDSLVELKSNASTAHHKRKKTYKGKHHNHKESKTPLPMSLNSARPGVNNNKH